MEKIKLQTSAAASDQKRQDRVNTLLHNEIILSLMRKNNLTDPDVQERPDLFEAAAKSLAACKGCKGLDCCTQPFRGLIESVMRDEDGFLDRRYQKCHYMTQNEELTAHARRFTRTHMSEKDFLIDFNKLRAGLSNESKGYILTFTQAVTSHEQDYGLFIYGQPGTGKSTLMMALANKDAQEGKSVAYVRVPRLISDLKSVMGQNEENARMLFDLRRAQVLYLDDFGSEMMTRWSRDEILFPLLEERMDQHKKTYFASNMSQKELQILYQLDGSDRDTVAAKRLMERVIALSDEVALKGESRRKHPGGQGR